MSPLAQYRFISPVALIVIGLLISSPANAEGLTLEFSGTSFNAMANSATEPNSVDNKNSADIQNDITSVSPVSEPETYAMFLIGFGLISFTARRGQKNNPTI